MTTGLEMHWGLVFILLSPNNENDNNAKMNWRGLKTVLRVALLLFVFFLKVSPLRKRSNLKQCSAALSASAVCLCVRYVCVCVHVHACRLRNFNRLTVAKLLHLAFKPFIRLRVPLKGKGCIFATLDQAVRLRATMCFVCMSVHVCAIRTRIKIGY